jgi:RNA polymerase subunit RPABC4/transcription elongation factor Spt4
MEEAHKDIFLSCFKCGRIVRSSDTECPRCGLQFGPGTLFECPFCCGLIWRNAIVCTTCGIDLTKFSESVEKSSSGFDMDEFVDSIISTEVKELKESIRRVACPGCGLMIRGDEDKCPRCDLPLEEAQVDCPVCGEKLSIVSQSCTHCGAVFVEKPLEGSEALRPPKEWVEPARAPEVKAKARKKPAPPKKPTKKASKTKPKKPK